MTGTQLWNRRARRLGLVLALFAGGLLIFVLGNPYYSIFPTNRSPDYNAVLAVFFLATIFLTHRDQARREFWPIPFVFFVAALANWVLGLDLVRFPGDSGETVSAFVWDKLAQFIKIVLPILALVWLGGFKLGWVGLQRGRARTWIPVGLGCLVGFGVLGLAVGAGQGKDMGAMLSVIPAWLLFSLLNAFMEELWFRGLFLPRLAPLVGRGPAVLLVAVVFALSHIGATYVSPGEILQFLLPTFVVGLGAGWLMVRTDSLWGAVLVHAGADLFYALGFTFLAVG